MLSRLPIPAVGTSAYRQYRRSEGAFAPKVAEPLISRPVPAPVLKSQPARTSTEVDTTDLEWQQRHAAWLATEQGQAYAAEQALSIAERMSRIRSECQAEKLRDARQADAVAARGKAHQVRPSMGGKFSLGV